MQWPRSVTRPDGVLLFTSLGSAPRQEINTRKLEHGPDPGAVPATVQALG
jgi:hypothetical protein